jgi:16S rRNA (guanine1207-N2)-methyltransferase
MSHYFINDNNVKSEKRNLFYSYENVSFKFVSDNGVFSKNEIDDGSNLLLKTYLKYGKKGTVLDVGAGVGFLGVVISKINDVNVDMVEINGRAVELCKENIKFNNVKCNVYESDLYSAVNGKYDCVVTNPPIRAGKKVIFEIFDKSIEYLNDYGELWVVIRKSHGADSAKKEINSVFGNCEVVKKDKGFYVLKAVKK